MVERHEAAVFAPGTLWARVQSVSQRALDSGDLQPIPTDFEHVEEGGIRFLVRIIRHLARKEVSGAVPAVNRSNPFLPYDPAMYVADASPTHVCLLNKFNVFTTPATAEGSAVPEPAVLRPAKPEVVVKSAHEAKPAVVPPSVIAPPQASPKTEPDRSGTVDVAPPPAEDRPAGMATQNAAAPAGTSSPEPRVGIVRRVGTGEGMVRDLAAAWEQSENGDRIEIAQLAPLRVGLLEAHGKRVSLFTSLRKGQRPMVLFELPAAAQAGRGLWSIVGGGLSIEGLDFCVDLTARRGGDAELVLFELQASDLRLSDTSITVVFEVAQFLDPHPAPCRWMQVW